MTEPLDNARSAAELTKIPVEHLLCANAIYHALGLMNPGDPLRPSHFGMLSESVGSLRQIVLPDDEEDDEDDDNIPPDNPFDDDVKDQAHQPEPVAAAETQSPGISILAGLVNRFTPRGTR